MSDDALQCDLDAKAAIEAANGLVQIDYLTELVVKRQQRDLRESHILELQGMAIAGLYPCGGTYRNARDVVTISHSLHVPPEPAFVPSLVAEMVDWLANARASGVSTLDRAAYALWRLNWIHPFRGGNGRTSRAIAYLVLSMDVGLMLPGTPSLPTLIYENRDAYVEALRDADQSVRAGAPDPVLTTMNSYLHELVVRQLATVVDRLSSPSIDRRLRLGAAGVR